MTYSAYEESVASGRPVEVYRFVLAAGDTFQYTSAEDEVTVGGFTYSPVPISRGRVVLNPEDVTQALEVELPSMDPFAQLYLSVVPGSRAELTIQRFHRDDTPTPELATVFRGFVRSVSFVRDAHVAKVLCIPLAAGAARPIPRFTYQGLCNHVLYDARCQVDDEDAAYKHVGTVTSVSGNDITVAGVSGFGAGWFDGGRVELGTGGDFRSVQTSSGNVLTLMLPFSVDPTGTNVVVRAGCDHSLATCKSKFDNVVNYGGFAFIPTRNVFEVGLQV